MHPPSQLDKMDAPRVADETADAVLDKVTGEPDPSDAERAAKRLKTTTELPKENGMVTRSEHEDQDNSATATSVAPSAAPLPHGAPAWVEALNDTIISRLNEINDKINNRLKTVDNRLENLENKVGNIDARLANSTATESGDTIFPLRNTAGIAPPGAIFPGTYGELVALDENDAGTLLKHYDLALTPRASRNIRLRKFLGARF